MVLETSMKKLHSEEIKEPYNTLNRTKQTTLNKNWVKNSHKKEKRTTTKSTPLLRKSLGKTVQKVALRRQKGALQHTKQNRTCNLEEELSE